VASNEPRRDPGPPIDPLRPSPKSRSGPTDGAAVSSIDPRRESMDPRRPTPTVSSTDPRRPPPAPSTDPRRPPAPASSEDPQRSVLPFASDSAVVIISISSD
jgi:hypothetical protein